MSSKVIIVDDINWLKKGVYPRVVNYTATWCTPCRVVSGDIDKLSVMYPSVHFFKVDIDKHAEHVNKMGITSVPTFMFYKDILSEPVIIKGANIEKIKTAILNLVLPNY